MDDRQIIEEFLRAFGGGGDRLGFLYAAGGIARVLSGRADLAGITKGLYADLAKQHSTSAACVERDIRLLIEAMWERGDGGLWETVAGRKLDRRPSNKQFLDMAVNYLTPGSSSAWPGRYIS